ncbi:general transcription factor 3C polypeptide 5 isoform X5 [Cajanus cajan]|uniref:general transcription factor 3C polypeptide 5 isoform X5 n=1 Tax=Cajanus cajan TaxID=3821 RepID=UPI0010FADC20|nr:general transcription factor 3C polypeptide 5 isoform X5 [Cajanus cajan]
MGVIKDGTISGVIPDPQGFLVHYPAYPSSISRAVDTLGGIQGILKARNSQPNKLELRFRPEDPYSHPAFGELRPTNNLLLKISKRKPPNAHDAEACSSSGVKNREQENQPESVRGQEGSLCADIVARVPEAYFFDGMADYQHVIPVHADVARRKKRNWSELEEPHFDKGGFIDLDHEDVMIIVPPIFAPKDMPENLVLRPSTMPSSKKKPEEIVQHPFEKGMEPVLAIGFDIKEIPKKVNWEEYIPHDSDQWESQMVVSRMFDDRPIWPKDSLTERLIDKGLSFSHGMLRRLLSRISYYFSSGPFLRFWIKKGYDPRKDPGSRSYQRIDYRVPVPLQSYCDAHSANKSKHRWEDICAFRAFPYKFQTSLQLFELVDDYIQAEINKPPSQSTCTNKGLEENEELDNVEDEEEAVEGNDSEEEWEEEIDLVGDNEMPLPSNSYINMENISRTHLQELFGSFHPNAIDGEQVLANGSDEEYHIYEEDSEENYSDE